ncbi:ATP synthase subunit I [Gracilimonas sp.]|uniref:ATP synthase subunit I n=1 Tax=Gracilimonas sp. TaxID=1974203 RepID=UPI003BA941A0
MIENNGRSVMKSTSLVSALLILISAGFFFTGEQQGIAVLTGAMLSSVFVISSAWIFDTFRETKTSTFIKIFFFSTAIRFLLVLILFGILLGVTKIDEIYFTVSFIISYLCQSVTEMIFINKILQKSGS